MNGSLTMVDGHPPVAMEPLSLAATTDQARQASRDKAFAESLRLWQAVETQYGRSRDTACGLGRAHREIGELDTADRILAAAIGTFPDDAELAAEHALVAEARQDWPDASARWASHLERFPDLRLFHGEAALAAARAGQHEAAESILQAVLSEQPDALAFRVNHAIVAQYAERWAEAVRRWDMVLRLMPDAPAFVELRGNASWHASLQQPQDSEKTVEPTTAPDTDFTSIVTAFESLGDNCEFGLLQRKLGLEPISLFRFSAVKPDKMVTLLDMRFSPLGDPDHMVIECEGDEYIVADDRGYFWMHTFVRKGHMDEKKYLKQQVARITLLKRKLIFHLEAGDKIYICKNSHERVSDEMLHRVAQSLRVFGRNCLLGVRLSDDANPPGSVRMLADDILVGHVRTMSSSVDTIDAKSWELILRQAHAYRYARETPPVG